MKPLTKSEIALLGRFLGGEIKDDEEIKSFKLAAAKLASNKPAAFIRFVSNEISDLNPMQCARCSKISELKRIILPDCDFGGIKLHIIDPIIKILINRLISTKGPDEYVGIDILERIKPEQKKDGVKDDIQRLLAKMSKCEEIEFIAHLERKIAYSKEEEEKLLTYEDILKMIKDN